ncbi:hypothetical protein JTB14_008027 [Gonioctena quinquepunctata]|nr:hypothetical protein JTB14_008027 [Gonioctena quinquepunctata]
MPPIFLLIITSPPWLISCPEYDLRMTHFKKTETNPYLMINNFYEPLDSHLYTYCSKTEQGVDSAVVSLNSTLHFKMPDMTSTFTGELYDIYQALIHLKTDNFSRHPIISDSLSAITSIFQIYPKNPILLLISTNSTTSRGLAK